MSKITRCTVYVPEELREAVVQLKASQAPRVRDRGESRRNVFSAAVAEGLRLLICAHGATPQDQEQEQL